MSVHIFTVNEENFTTCITKGIVGLPEAKDSRMHDNIFDALLSRIACIKEDDYTAHLHQSDFCVSKSSRTV